MPRTLITGGAGFLGSHMCDRLVAEGHQVICVDNLLTGRKENIAHLLENESFTSIVHDITNPLEIEGDLDYILHFASPASPKDYMEHSIETMKTGAWGTYNMLELARKKEAVFILASTSEVYGDPQVHPQPEDYWGHVNPIGPRSVYDEAKRYAEALTMAYHRQYGLDVRIARIFNTYGPGMRVDDGRVVSNFIVQALKGEPITVYGDGSQTRSFCYVDDLIEGIYRLLLWQPDSFPGKSQSHSSSPITHNSLLEIRDLQTEKLLQRPRAKTQDLTPIFNVGNPDEHTILDLARLIKRITNSKSKIIFKPLPADEPQKRRPDITKIKVLLRWEPRVALQDGLQRTIEYFRQQLAL